jgi:hypothetical protein
MSGGENRRVTDLLDVAVTDRGLSGYRSYMSTRHGHRIQDSDFTILFPYTVLRFG